MASLFYLYNKEPDLDTANIGRGLGPCPPELEPSTNLTVRPEQYSNVPDR